MKEVTKREVEALINAGVILNTAKGYIERSGNIVGFYRTRHKRYLEDKYVDIARKIS